MRTGELTWKSANFVTEFGNTDMKSNLAEMIKEVAIEMQNNSEKSDKQVIYKQIQIDKKDYQVIIETVASRNKKNKRTTCNVLYRQYRIFGYFKEI